MIPVRNIILKLAGLFILCVCFSFDVTAQSTDQNFPTAVTTNEIDGVIKARDIGDSRLTSYFYAFDVGQGDVFINVVTNNFSGDIDVFTVDGLRPLTKMVIYADSGSSETGRIVYLRKPERLILRVEGRSPNDDPSTFKIKFAGSFVALANQKQQDAPTIKSSDVDPESGIRVNSVGTIVEVIPKPQPSPKATPESKEAKVTIAKNKKPETGKKNPPAPTAITPKKEIVEVAKTKVAEKKPAPAKAKNPVKESEKKESATAKPAVKKTDSPEVKTVFKKTPKSKKAETAKKAPEKPTRPAEPTKESQPDPMASIRLVIQLKDGKVIERPMNEVAKFGVDNGVLTVIAKDGTTLKYSILDVAKLTVE